MPPLVSREVEVVVMESSGLSMSLSLYLNGKNIESKYLSMRRIKVN